MVDIGCPGPSCCIRAAIMPSTGGVESGSPVKRRRGPSVPLEVTEALGYDGWRSVKVKQTFC